MQRIHFILLQGFIVFHQGITFTLGPNEPFGRSISLNSAPARVQTEAAARAQRRPLYKQCPTPTSNRGSGTCIAQAILIEVAPPRVQTEAGTCTAQAII